MIKALGILLAVCFLMSTTAAAWQAESRAAPMEAKESMKEKMLGKISEEKGLSECKNVFIRNLIIAKNIIIIKARAHPLLRAKALKGAAKYEGPCYVQLNGVCLDNKPMQAGGSGKNLGEATYEAVNNYNYGCYNRGFGPGAYYVSRQENC